MRNPHFEDLFAGLSHSPGFRGVLGRFLSSRPGPPVRLSGLTLAAKAVYLSLLYRETRRPLVVVTDGNKEAETLQPLLRTFCSLFDAGAAPQLLPAFDALPGQGMSPHADILATRAMTLELMARGECGIVVAPAAAALGKFEEPAYYRQLNLKLRVGEEISLDDLAFHLESTGYEKRDPVEMPGEYSIRGGILDVFPADQPQPVRIEFFGDEIEEIRRFDPETQRSIHKLTEVTLQPLTEFQRPPERLPGWELMMPALRPRAGSLMDFCERGIVVIDEPEKTKGGGEKFWSRLTVENPEAFAFTWDEFLERALRQDVLEVRQLDVEASEGPDSFYIPTRPSMAFHGNLQVAIKEAKTLLEAGSRLAFFAPATGEIERLADVFSEYSVPYQIDLAGERTPEHLRERSQEKENAVALIRGDVERGTTFTEAGLTIFGSEDLFESPETTSKPRKSHLGTFSADQFDLKPGDFIVHTEHGVGQFVGLRVIDQGDAKGDYMLVEYAGGNKLYVPLTRLDLIQRLRSGDTEQRPVLDKMGGATWVKTKTRVKAKMRDMADELLKLYAQRRLAEGFAFSPDSNWQREFEDAFEYTETRDQKQAIVDIKRDMEAEQPMDRLLCGDVGYGKTEVVMRAAFKALGDGKQVALLSPTTVLCFQHFNTLRKRFQQFPVRIEMLSRFRNAKETAVVLEDLEAGKVDIAVGTHRLFSKDVIWKDLGLVIVDEEQRFGVKHKERLKEIRKSVDVVTMSATPIPRTLHMSLLGLRDMSVIETPPRDRLAIHTVVAPFDPGLIRPAIELELGRGGQVYFVHNRIDSIFHRAAMIQEMFPEIKIGVGHGQMPEAELEKVMLQFMAHEFDVFVCTTIVENGLDNALANTMIIEKAEKYGLSELYQLRGRVGRSSRRAYCYLLVEPDTELTEIARKRLAALKEFSDLGAGFKIAALDLELRGAGNLLGGEQHGHINAIGFDMYIRMLEETVRELRGEEVLPEIRSSLNLGLDLRIPPSYIADENQRLRAYKRIAQASSEEERDKLGLELADRYGPLPDDIRHLLRYSGVKAAAEQIGIEAVDRRGPMLNVKFHDQTRVDAQKLMTLVSSTRGAQFTPAGVLRLPMEGGMSAVPTAAEILGFLEHRLIGPLV
ncbi:MAG: transcription-repair coupling factor [Bryobacterales bacterium]|nr:transcription-repair coupling factor [Bryobacterales bacterium]